MTGILNILAGAISAAIKDTYFNLTTLLLPGDGTNGAQNNTFLDSSSNNFTITRNGNTTQGTFSPFSQTGWGNYFDGDGDYLSSPNNTAIHVLGSDFCLEGWFFLTAAQGNNGLYSTYATSGGNESGYIIRLTSTQIQVALGPGTGLVTVFNRTYSFSVGQWYHFAVTSSSSTGRIFVNGVQQGATFTTSGFSNSTSTLQIGRTHTTTYDFPGYLSNFRIVKGSAVYTSDFTPSTTPLTAITNTSLLTCQSNRFIDVGIANTGSTPFPITVNGTPSVQAFSPFAPTAAYSASVVGGSGYFDGSGDYLTAADNTAFEFGSGNFTIEAWVYVTATPGASGASIITKSSATYPGGYEFNFVVQNDRKAFCGFYTTAQVDLTGTTALPLNAWAHLAVSRSGSNFALFVNGTREATTSTSGTIQATSSSLYVGDYGGGSRTLTGYISGARLVKGTAVYDPTLTTLTLPTAPPTAVTNTSFLLNFTNAGITDATGKNVLETVGNAQISTTQSKWGGSSIYLDGNGDYLKRPSSQLYVFNGDFTIEFWAWKSASGLNNYDTPVSCDSDGNATNGWALELGTVRYFYFVANGGAFSVTSSSFTVNDSAWHHYAVTRSGSTVRLFRDGTQIGSGTYSSAIGNSSIPELKIGAYGTATTNAFNGYIDDLRITNGYARYTANFTPPTQAFALQ